MAGETLPRLAGTARTIEVDGRKYKVAPLSIGQLAELQQWAADLAEVRPFKALTRKLAVMEGAKVKIPPAVLEKLYADADAESRDPAAIDRISDSWEGTRKTFAIMLASGQPDITEEEIEKILSVRGMQAIRKLVDEVNLPGGKRENPTEPAEPEGAAGS